MTKKKGKIIMKSYLMFALVYIIILSFPISQLTGCDGEAGSQGPQGKIGTSGLQGDLGPQGTLGASGQDCEVYCISKHAAILECPDSTIEFKAKACKEIED